MIWMDWFVFGFWIAVAFGVYSLWFVRDCPTWGHVWRKMNPPPRLPRAIVKRLR